MRGHVISNVSLMRSVRYAPNMSALCVLAIIKTVPLGTNHVIRAFLHRHLLSKVLFKVSMVKRNLSKIRQLAYALQDSFFVLEFHIPFFALRRGGRVTDHRTLHQRPLRASRHLPLARQCIPAESDDHYYEAQLSLTVVGVDEWLWTAYCCVDTYFPGGEPSNRSYLASIVPADPPSGGGLWLNNPEWKPRQYFLIVLARRIMQAAREWSALVNAFEDRLISYVSLTIYFEDAFLNHDRRKTCF